MINKKTGKKWDLDDFAITTASGTLPKEPVPFDETQAAFKTLNFTDEEQLMIYKTTQAVLLLGNVEFNYVADGSFVETGGKTASQPKEPEMLQDVCELLEIRYDDFQLLICVQFFMGKMQNVPSMIILMGNRNAILKEIYNRMFNWLVQKLNRNLLS